MPQYENSFLVEKNLTFWKSRNFSSSQNETFLLYKKISYACTNQSLNDLQPCIVRFPEIPFARVRQMLRGLKLRVKRNACMKFIWSSIVNHVTLRGIHSISWPYRDLNSLFPRVHMYSWSIQACSFVWPRGKYSESLRTISEQ